MFFFSSLEEQGCDHSIRTPSSYGNKRKGGGVPSSGGASEVWCMIEALLPLYSKKDA